MKILKNIYTYSALLSVFFSIVFFPFAQSYESSTVIYLSIATGISFLVLFVSGATYFYISGDAKRKQEEAINKWKSIPFGPFIKTQFYDALPIVLIFGIALIFTKSDERLLGLVFVVAIILYSLIPNLIAWLKSRNLT